MDRTIVIWFPKLFLYGIQCITFLKNVFILHGTGVGGGSLVYANTLLVPKDEAFEDNRWIGGKWKEKLSPYYKKAQAMLGVTTADYLSDSDYILKEVANDMKLNESHTYHQHKNWEDVEINYELSDKIYDDLLELSSEPNLDIILVPYPIMNCVKEAQKSCWMEDKEEYNSILEKIRVCKLDDRVTKVIRSDKFCK